MASFNLRAQSILSAPGFSEARRSPFVASFPVVLVNRYGPGTLANQLSILMAYFRMRFSMRLDRSRIPSMLYTLLITACAMNIRSTTQKKNSDGQGSQPFSHSACMRDSSSVWKSVGLRNRWRSDLSWKRRLTCGLSKATSSKGIGKGTELRLSLVHDTRPVMLAMECSRM